MIFGGTKTVLIVKAMGVFLRRVLMLAVDSQVKVKKRLDIYLNLDYINLRLWERYV